MNWFSPKTCQACLSKDAAHVRELAARDAELYFLRSYISQARSIVREPTLRAEVVDPGVLVPPRVDIDNRGNWALPIFSRSPMTDEAMPADVHVVGPRGTVGTES